MASPFNPGHACQCMHCVIKYIAVEFFMGICVSNSDNCRRCHLANELDLNSNYYFPQSFNCNFTRAYHMFLCECMCVYSIYRFFSKETGLQVTITEIKI